jgi:hypothetical protein
MPPLPPQTTPVRGHRPDAPLALTPALFIAAHARRARRAPSIDADAPPDAISHLVARARIPDEAAEQQICSQASDLVTLHGRALERFVRDAARRRARRGDVWERGQRDMVATIGQLGKHAWPLDEYVSAALAFKVADYSWTV